MTKQPKPISPEDQEVLLTLGILKTVTENIMANIQDAVDAVNAFGTKIDSLITETTNADNRFEAKLAALQAQITALQNQTPTSVDTQPVVDVLTNLGQKVDTQIAAQQVSGV